MCVYLLARIVYVSSAWSFSYNLQTLEENVSIINRELS